ncbi:hypothetical protein GCM10027047_34360 [Rhodococcus aerolatus]
MTAPTTNPPLGPVTRAWQLLTLGADRLRRVFAAELGVSVTELNAVAHLYRHGETTAGHLAEGLGLGVAGTTTVIDHLERAGYARRVTHPDDRRVRLVSLTPGGVHAAEWVIERSTEAVRPALDGCTDDELTRLAELIRAMADGMGA